MNSPIKPMWMCSEEQTEKVTGLSVAQLRYWTRTRLYRLAHEKFDRYARFGRTYTFKDIVAIRVLNVLRNQYAIPPRLLREVGERFSGLPADPERWVETRLFPFHKRVVWQQAGEDVPREVASGQFVSSVLVSDVIQATTVAMSRLPRGRKPEEIGAVARSRYILNNTLVFAGTRIPVSAIKRLHEDGLTVDAMLKHYPDLTPADVATAIAHGNSAAAA